VTTRPDDEHLDEYELWARDHLEPVLGSLPVIDKKGSPPGLHDFEADLPSALVAALEVTSEVESDRLSVASEIRQRGLSRYPVPGLNCLWSVRLTENARVGALSRRRDELRQLLRALEAQGARYAHAMGDYRSETVQLLRALRIGSVHRLGTQRGGGVVMGSDAYGGFGWDGSAIDAWLDGLLSSNQGINKLEKLGRAKHAVERHLVVVIDTFSPAGIGIPLGETRGRDVADVPCDRDGQARCGTVAPGHRPAPRTGLARRPRRTRRPAAAR
jgi:hypothetical protein